MDKTNQTPQHDIKRTRSLTLTFGEGGVVQSFPRGLNILSIYGMSERMSEDMSERMSEDMSERMTEDMSERMSEDMSEEMSERYVRRYVRKNVK